MGFLDNLFGKKDENAKNFKDAYESFLNSNDLGNTFNIHMALTQWLHSYAKKSEYNDFVLSVDEDKLERRIKDANYWYAKAIMEKDIKITEEHINTANSLKAKDQNLAEWYKSTANEVLSNL